MSYIISFDKAVEYITAFVYTLKPHTRGLPLGGTIDVASFWDSNKFTNYKGNMAWFCVSKSLKYPRLFLAFEENNSYDSRRVVRRPEKEELAYSQSVFGYSNEDIACLLENHTVEPSNGGENIFQGQKILKEDVIKFKKLFKSKIDRDVNNKPLNKYPYGFFENVDHREVNDFATQTGIRYVRYYFGYDDTSEYNEETNRIRIILVAVDEHGKNIVRTGDRAKDETVIMLQKSWPPPPNS